ncbi:MAG: lipopolysaccharide biosynthesis protein [Crocinitomicaceae bacterium]|nr:lipopolysaccharide biosynthesis protein [Crocinitomicaceae bacterium]|tara:strand:+ start:18845 stop:20149 length:1305 start_codon:yes stop_codon:yes gene_type:complete
MITKLLSKLDVHTLEVVKKSFSSIIVKVLGVLIVIGLSVFLARTIGAEGLGIINLSHRIVAILLIVGLFGMTKVIIKEVAIALNKNELQHIGNVMHTSYWLNGSITILLSALLILSSPWLANNIFQEPKLTYPLIISFVVMTPQVFSRIFSSGLIGYRKIWQSNLVEQTLSAFLTGLFLLLYWLFLGELNVNIVAVFYAIGRIGVTICVGLYWKKLYLNNGQNKKIFNQLLKTAKPLFLVSIAGVIINSSDIIILGLFSSAKEVGIYLVAARISLLTNMLLLVTNSAISPKIATLYADKDTRSMENMLKKITKGLFIIGLFVYFIFITFGDWILAIWGPEFREAYPILLILGFGQLINLGTGAVGMVLTMTGHEKIQRNISITFMVIFLTLSFFLASKYGILGSAIASAITISGINLAKLFYVKKHIKINIYRK